MWTPPNITLRWPSWFQPDAEEDAKLVDMAIKAEGAGLVTKRAAVQKLQRTFQIENVDQFLETLEEEKAKAMKAQQQMAADLFEATGSGTEDDDGGEADEPGAPTGRGFGGAARKA